jgi:hypothetical protein
MPGELPIMTPAHPQWADFLKRLEGPEGCNFRREKPDDPRTIRWECAGGNNKDIARRILGQVFNFNGQQIEQSFRYFEGHGGYCDCEIIFNIQPRAPRRNPKRKKKASHAK